MHFSGLLTFCALAAFAVATPAKKSIAAKFVKGQWPSIGGDHEHASFVPETIGKPQPRKLWEVTPNHLDLPLVFNNEVFVMTLSCVLKVYDARTGELKRERIMGCGVNFPPMTIVENRLVIQVKGGAGRNTVYLLSPDTLKTLFTVTTDGKSSNWFYQDNAVGENGLVYFPGGTRGEVVHAVSSKDGQIVFQSSLSDKFWREAMGFALKNGRLFVSFYDQNYAIGVIELDPRTGQQVRNLSIPTSSSDILAWAPVLTDDILLVSYQKTGVLAYNLTDFEYLWSVHLPDFATKPSADDRFVYVYSRDGLHALDKLTGRMKVRYAECVGLCGQQTVVTNDYVIAPTTTGALVFDKLSGSLVARISNSGYYSSLVARPAAYADNVIYLTTYESMDKLVAYELS